MTERIIVHIDGLPGSGKTTLGQKLNKLNNVHVIDTDDISDKNVIEMLNKADHKKLQDLKEQSKLIDKLNAKNIDDTIAILGSRKEHVLVFIGNAIPFLEKYSTHKYFLDINMLELFKRINLRTLNSIVENKAGIEKTLKNTTNAFITESMCMAKYKIRLSFPASFHYLEDRIFGAKKYADEHNYVSLSDANLYKAIEKLSKT